MFVCKVQLFGPELSGELSNDWCRTTLTHHHTDRHTLLCCLFGPTFSWYFVLRNDHPVSCSHTNTRCCMPTHPHNGWTDAVLMWLHGKCCKSQSPRPASFVCPQLFRPVACIVLPGSLPGALWLKTSSLIGPERDREELFLLRLVRSRVVVSF